MFFILYLSFFLAKKNETKKHFAKNMTSAAALAFLAVMYSSFHSSYFLTLRP